MVSSLTGQWNQPVFVDFDTKMTAPIILDIITKLHEIGFEVVSVVSDCGATNVALWDKLGLSYKIPFFLHPVTKNKIVYMPAVQHLLQLLRNWFINEGFVLGDGSIINKTPVKDLLQIVNTKNSVCPKLNENHLTCQKSQHENVTLAAQLISNSVGRALIRYKPGWSEKLATDTGKFLVLMNNWFDIMNVNTTKVSVPSKSPYGLKLKEQNEILDEVFLVIQHMRVNTKHLLQNFQKGILMTCCGSCWRI